MNRDKATAPQIEAIMTDERDVLAIAGPGSGKTTVLVARILRLVNDAGVNPKEIAVLSFTNAAASEIQRRLSSRATAAKDSVPDPAGGHVVEVKPAPAIELGFVGTLHSFALRMLKEHGGPFGYGDRVALISPESAADLLESKAKTIGCKTPLKDLLAMKAAGRPERTARLDLASTVVASYYDDLRETGVVDYDVLLFEFRNMLTGVGLSEVDALEVRQRIGNQFSALFVDEVQDSAPLDWEIFRAIPAHSKFYVGDPDQAIFSFRGGRVREMMQHAGDVGTHTIRLEENFRSSEEICEGAQRLIERNRWRLPKRTVSVSGPGGKIYVPAPCTNEGEEIGAVARTIIAILGTNVGVKRTVSPSHPPLPSIAVLARTNAIAEGFRGPLTACGIPVVGRTKSELPRDWRLARALAELLVAPDNDSLAFFYLVALYEKKGATPREARESAHAVRREATAAGKSINRSNLGFRAISDPANALKALAAVGVSRESVAIAAEKFRDLPAGATMLDLSLALAEVRDYVKEEEGEGVHLLTIHGAKGREFDVVFVVGLEDEVFPGKRAIGSGEEAIEEERRLAYVAVTRARRAVYLTWASSRVQIWGKHKEVQKRTPSRFIAEIVGGAS